MTSLVAANIVYVLSTFTWRKWPTDPDQIHKPELFICLFVFKSLFLLNVVNFFSATKPSPWTAGKRNKGVKAVQHEVKSSGLSEHHVSVYPFLYFWMCFLKHSNSKMCEALHCQSNLGFTYNETLVSISLFIVLNWTIWTALLFKH